MQNDRVVIFGGLVLAWGETTARPADILLAGDSKQYATGTSNNTYT